MVRITRKHHLAIELRYLGRRYESISQQTSISIATLYKYFAKGGMLDSAYRQYESEMNTEALRAAKEGLRKNSSKAVDVLVQSLSQSKKNPSLALKAATYILESCGIGKSINESTEFDMAEEIVKAMELGKEQGIRTAKGIS